jgi:hypothetical protein
MRDEPILIIERIGEIPEEMEGRWNQWYDDVHIANRLNVPGFVSVRRYRAVENERQILARTGPPDEIALYPRRYLTLFELGSVDVLRSEAYGKLLRGEASQPSSSFEAITPKLPNFNRATYERVYPDQGKYQRPNTNFVFVMGHDVPPDSPDREEEFNVWYNTEHIPRFMKKVPGFAASRRFKLVETELPAGARNTSSNARYLAIHDFENEGVPASEAFWEARDTPWTRWVKSWYSRRYRILARCIYTKENR